MCYPACMLKRVSTAERVGTNGTVGTVRGPEGALRAAADPASAVNTQSNAVRTVGNMLHWLTRERLDGEAEFERVMAAGTAAMVAAIHTGKIMKIRWNACYAASNVLRKPGLEQNYAWKRELLACLLDTVTNHQICCGRAPRRP